MAKKKVQGRKSNKLMGFVSLLLLLTIAAALAAFIYTSRAQKNEDGYRSRVQEQRVLGERIAKYALASASGNKTTFKPLEESKIEYEALLTTLKKGDPATQLPPLPADLKPSFRDAESKWLALRQVVDEVLGAEKPILSIGEYVDVITDLSPQLQAFTDEVVAILVKKNVSPDQVAIAGRQAMLAQRIENNVGKVLSGGAETALAIDQFSQDADEFGRVLEGMIKGDKRMGIKKVDSPEALKVLREVAMLFTTVKDNAEEIIAQTPAILPALETANKVGGVSDDLDAALTKLDATIADGVGRFRLFGHKFGSEAIILLGILSLFLLIWLGLLILRAARRREEESAEQYRRNQEAIRRLLDEIGDLEDGDLSVNASVSEDITGAIADSINSAIDELRGLVTTINRTSDQVSGSAQETRATAIHLAEASDHQADQITSASLSIKEMASAIDEMAADATESAEVAGQSVDIAAKGAGTVRRGIQGMESIREQIQETSKRIKRLGESSQQIGDIVELIDDIADQTNILALNAAMQAAMAGEAGRGFAVVADEVQRLAERSSNATKQIEALVRTIQADTNEAVSSMEASTAGVVSGARLAEDAGEALNEIEQVSIRFAEITSRISSSAQRQSGQAAEVAETMSVIQEITTQTSEGTQKTAASIGQLVELADDLQNSVARFRLPD